MVVRLRRLRPRHAPSYVRRSSISRPKSRFVEAPIPPRASAAPASQNQTPRCATVSTPHAPASQIQRPRCAAVSSPHIPADPDDDEDLFRRAGAPASTSAARCHHRAAVGLELAVLVLFLAVLLVSLVVRPLKGRVVWGLEIWKWCVLVITVFSGHLVSQWVVTFIIFLIDSICHFTIR